MSELNIIKYKLKNTRGIFTFTTSTELIEKLIEKRKRKVADGIEGFMADFSVRHFKKTGQLLNDETLEDFVQSLASINFIEIVE